MNSARPRWRRSRLLTAQSLRRGCRDQDEVSHALALGIPQRLETIPGRLKRHADDVIIAPLGARRALGDFVLIAASTPERSPAVIQQATEVLRQRHNIAFNGEDDFSVASSQDIQNTFASVTNVITIFLATVAGISLFVGGIGIMNIMLVSVTERTREIGLRKAIGAKRLVILAQFLIEAALIGLFGGLLGVGTVRGTPP